MSLAALCLALAGFQAPVDEGVFVVRQDTAEIARETFRLSQGGDGAWTLAASIRYDQLRPALVLAPILEVGRDSQPSRLEFDVANPRDPWRIVGQVARGRFTVRFLGRHSERAREFPVIMQTVIVDDSAFSAYVFAAWLAGRGVATISAIVPRAGRRDTLAARDLGTARTTLNRDPATLRHITLDGGPNGHVDLWLDEHGRLLKIEIPSRRLRVERLPPA